MKYTTRNTGWHVVPEERAGLHDQYQYAIEIDADSDGEYVKLEHASGDTIAIGKDAWPELRRCIDAALAECDAGDVCEWDAGQTYEKGDRVIIDGVEKVMTPVGWRDVL